MKLTKLISILIIFLIIPGCGTSSLLERPEYKPMDRENEKVVDLWQKNEQYYLTSILQDFGNVELSFGNNGTIGPNSYLSKTLKTGFGLSIVLEVINKGEKDYKIDLNNTFIKDKNGVIWKLSRCEKIVDNNRMDSSVNLKPFHNSTLQSKLYTNKTVEEFSTEDILKVESNSSSNFFLIFSSEYNSADKLPSLFTFNIQTQLDGSTYNNSYKFDKIDW